MPSLPETVLQFGSGRFLRAFADLFIHHGNRAGQNVGKVVIVQSTGDARAGALTQQGGQYHVVVRGLENGQTVDRVEECGSVSRALHAGTQWGEVLELARSPHLHTILSNTTEAGYDLDPNDDPGERVPRSFPAKLLAVLKARHDAHPPGVLPAGLTVIPCELIEGNAGKLRDTVVGLARKWYPSSAAFVNWLQAECVWLHTLVDRIVTGPPKDLPLLATDPLVIVAEPFAFWALEEHPKSKFTLDHPAITRTRDVEPYFLRKVRILNAAHTALCVKARPRGFALVREAINDPQLSAWLWRLLSEEIVPTLEGRVDQPRRFAEQTIERFRNPFLEHKFSDIASHHESKMRIRLLPTRDEYAAKFGRQPPLLSEVIEEGFRQLNQG